MTEIEQKALALVVLAGSDDSTTMEIAVTIEERAFLERLAELSEETSTCGCMPVLYIRDPKP